VAPSGPRVGQQLTREMVAQEEVEEERGGGESRTLRKRAPLTPVYTQTPHARTRARTRKSRELGDEGVSRRGAEGEGLSWGGFDIVKYTGIPGYMLCGVP
jgi:hypothetical protein